MGTIIWKNVIMLIAVMVIGIILVLLGIWKRKSLYFRHSFSRDCSFWCALCYLCLLSHIR